MKYYNLDSNIIVVDAEYIMPQIASIYIVKDTDSVAIIETGTRYSVKSVLKALVIEGMSPEQVKYIIPTHVHLDHAGGAASLIEATPNSKLLIHPRGMPHMVDPKKLTDGVIAVYGEEFFDRIYGGVTPIPKERVISPEDKSIFTLDERSLEIVYTPGHALHHFSVWDKVSRGLFTGDSFGISYRAFDRDGSIFIFPTVSPVQFDPDTMIESIDKMAAYNPKWLYLTHFSAVLFNDEIKNDLKNQVLEFSKIGEKYLHRERSFEEIRKDIVDHFIKHIKEHGAPISIEEGLKILDNDISLNSRGLIAWLERLDRMSKEI